MNKLKLCSVALGLAFSMNSLAVDWTVIDDMSKLEYQIKDDRVWLRNMNEFNASWLDCCYAYFININTAGGKATWSAMLAKIITGESYNVGVANKGVNGSEITFSGEW